MQRSWRWWGAGLILLAMTSAAPAQVGRNVEIKATEVAENVYMLEGQGGNMGLSIGADGAFLIDDQFAPLTGMILAKVEELTDQPVRFVLNTHWHGDHTGGNENMHGEGAMIVAHENVRMQMQREHSLFGNDMPPSPLPALPTITFTDSMTFHWNGETIIVQHLAPAHTDGDSIVYFESTDVLHMGDAFFNGLYPFIDVSTGGSLSGMIAAANTVLAMVNDKTKIIPGHGPLASADDLVAYRNMMQAAHDAIRPLVDAGKTRDEVVTAKPTAALDAEWGGGFLEPDVWVGIVYDGMTSK